MVARTPRPRINKEKCSQCGKRDHGRIGLGADPSNKKLAEGSTSSVPCWTRGRGWGESGGSGFCEGSRSGGECLLPSNAPRHPALGYLGPPSWPRQVTATRNPWLTLPSNLNLSNRGLFGRTGAKSAWVVSGWVQPHTRGILHRCSYGYQGRNRKANATLATFFLFEYHYGAAVSFWCWKRKNTAWCCGIGVLGNCAEVFRNGGFLQADRVLDCRWN